MRRFVYAPDVEAYISTDSGIIDVSADIISGTVTRRVNAASEASLVLQNPYRKYLMRIKSMDKIVIYLTRVKRQLVFSGYIDSAPLDQLYPEPVKITASCTIKRLLYTYWNPQLPYVTKWFASKGWTLDPLTGNIFDMSGSTVWNMDINSSLGQMMKETLNAVGGWPIGNPGESRNSVQILALPQKFITTTQKLLTSELAAQQAQEQNVQNFLNQLLMVQGSTTDPFGSTNNTASGGTYNLSDGTHDANPAPAFLGGKYTATTFGPKFPLNGLAAELQKQCQTSTTANIADISTEQCQNAATIFQVVTQNGFTDQSAAGWIAVSFAESTLIANKVQPGDPNNVGYGLFQLTSDGFYGPNGVLAQVIKETTGQVVDPERGDQYVFNPTYNTLAILRNANAIDTVNNSNEPFIPIEDLYLRPAGGTGISSDDYPRSSEFYPYALAAIQAINNSSSSNQDTSTQGNVGDVKVNNQSFFDKNGTGYTFKIIPNPYGNNSYIFQASAIDKTLKSNEISIYIPQDTPQAQNWTNGPVSLETSINQANPFPPPSGTAGGAVQIDPSQMTGAELSGKGGVSTANLQPITVTGLAYVQFNFGPFKLTSGYRAGDSGDHGKGLAIDLVPIDADGNEWPAEGITRADALAKWCGFLQQPPSHSDTTQPDTAGNSATRWVGWRYVGGHGPPSGPGAYPNGYPGEGSGPHLHISWQSGANAESIPPVNGNTTNNITNSSGVLGGTGVLITSQNVTQAIASIGVGLPLVFPMVENAAEAQLFKGERAYQDDQPLIEFIDFLCKSSGRVYQSLPNGDFFAFYPDYFNWANQSPYFIISDIEAQGLTIDFSDDPLATHVYTTADTQWQGQITLVEELSSTVSSIESAGIFEDLINLGSNFDYVSFLQRYGARPMNKEVLEIKNSFMQFMVGWMTFLEQWAKLFQANPTFTFMPELYPGGLVQFSSKDLVMYINEVTHNFDRQAGFTTTANLIAPSTTGASTGSWTYGMVLAKGGLG